MAKDPNVRDTPAESAEDWAYLWSLGSRIEDIEDTAPEVQKIVGVIRGIKSIAITFTAIAVIAGAISYAVKLGLFQ